jgi:tetratricopeptide (TPR) repeat protein
MATGAPAVPGDSVGMVFYHILNRDPVPARQVNPAVPAELADLLSRVLVKNRDLRPQRAGELLRDLRHLRRSLRAPRPAASPGQGRSAGRPGTPRPLWRRRWLWVGAICVAGLAAVALAAVGFLRGREPALTERDSVLLADFRNSTGDSVFDGTLAQALGVQLSQSPFLNIVPEERVRETLRLMGRGTEERPAGDVAREVCQRLGVKAMVGGSISRLGTLYVLLVDASNCVTGASLAREQGSSERQEEVLRTLGTMASTLRTRLGESLKSVERFDVPIAQATTPSLDALKAYTLGLAQRAKGAELESIPFLERALELDPKFAAAATTLSTVYGNLNEFGKGEEYARLAYGNSAHVSERERLFITYQYHDRVTGDQVQAADTLEVWKQTYPGDFRPPNALSILYNRLGRFDRGVAEGQEALRRSPGHPFALSNLAYAYRGLGRFADAKKTAEEAVALGIATVPTRRLLYQLAVLEGDMAAAERHVAWAKEKPREFDLMSAQAQIAAYQGRMRASTELYRTSVELAERQGLSESTSAYLAHQALGHVLYGDRLRASAFGRAALRSGRESSATSIPRLRAVIALGLLDDPEVAPILRSAEERYPQSTFTRAMLVPTSLAAVELARGRPDAALDALNAAAPYETGTVAALIPVYLRGLAYLARGAGAPALEQFQKILDHRGTDPFSPVCALAYLGRARAWRLMGDHGESARAYAEFLAVWEHADPDIPVLVQARKEYERLGPATH